MSSLRLRLYRYYITVWRGVSGMTYADLDVPAAGTMSYWADGDGLIGGSYSQLHDPLPISVLAMP